MVEHTWEEFVPHFIKPVITVIKKNTVNACMSTNKSLNYLDNQNTPKHPTSSCRRSFRQRQVLHWYHFSYLKWSPKQQPTDQHNRRGDKRRVVSYPQYQQDQHLQNWLWCSSQCNSRKPDWNTANKTRNNKIKDNPKLHNRSNVMKNNCNACQKYRNLNPREPLLSKYPTMFGGM